MTERWIGLTLAAVSVGQLVVAEWGSSKTGEFAKKYFKSSIEKDKSNELGLPNDAALRQRLLDEVYNTSELAADGSSVLTAELAAFAGVVFTCVISVQAKDVLEAWISGTAALFMVYFIVLLIIQLLDARLSRYVVAESGGRHQKKTKEEESSWWRRSAHNLWAAIARYFYRLSKPYILTRYKASVVVAGIVLAVIGVLI